MMYCMYIIIFCTLSHTYTRAGTPTKEGKVSDSVVERSRWWGATDWWPNDSVRRRRFWLIGVQLPLRDDPRDNNITGYFIFTTACIDPEGDKTIPGHGCKVLREGQKRVKNHWPWNADLHVSNGVGVYLSQWHWWQTLSLWVYL